jgi:tripartite-type tricarboxylate transporter receptor subunit TctC
MMRGILALSIAVIIGLALAGGGPLAAPSFYEGKALRIIVGLAPGGGFDTYARLLHAGSLVRRKTEGRPLQMSDLACSAT